MSAEAPGLLDAAAVEACLSAQLDRPVSAKLVERPGPTLRREGRGGIVIGELIDGPSSLLDGFLALTAPAARTLGTTLLAGQPSTAPWVGPPVPPDCVDAVQQLLAALLATVPAESGASWVLGRTTLARGAQDLDPHLATARGLRVFEVGFEGAPGGFLAMVLGPAPE